MKKKLLIIGTFIATVAIVVLHPVFDKRVDAKPNLPVNNIVTGNQPRIQLAILLDTSSSMSGLIDQTRNQLWQVVNEFAKSKKNDITPSLEVAIYEYGNSRLSAEGGYIRQVTALTGELDQVSEALFSLTTNGGDEFCGYVINNAVKDLNWSDNEQDIKLYSLPVTNPSPRARCLITRPLPQLNKKASPLTPSMPVTTPKALHQVGMTALYWPVVIT